MVSLCTYYVLSNLSKKFNRVRLKEFGAQSVSQFNDKTRPSEALLHPGETTMSSKSI